MTRLFTLLLLASIAVAAGQDDLVRQAHNAYLAEDWAKAQALYTKLAGEKPDHALAWYRLGESCRHQRQFREALSAFGKARQLGFQPFTP